MFEPTFTFHGFRYAEVTGWPGEITPGSLHAIVVHSEMKRTGTFECSDPLLNRLHSNTVWSMRGNFCSIPTDCPQRDERLGWTGDIAAFAPTAAFLFDVRSFLDEWLVDLHNEQKNLGSVPFVVPNIVRKYSPFPNRQSGGAAIWSDAAAWVPWALWNAYGDKAALEKQYPAMLLHVKQTEAMLSPSGLWDSGFQFADWLDPTAPPENPFQAKADKGVVATAAFYRSLRIVAEAAGILQRTGDAAEVGRLRDKVGEAFRQQYIATDGKILSDCPTVYTIAIAFGLVDGPAKTAAGKRLAELAKENGFRIATGFAGTAFILDALLLTRHVDVVYKLLMEKTCPSWLYPVTMGATTIWERWDSMLPDGRINSGEMTSFNHYALAPVVDWIHRNVAGIQPLAPGYAKVRIAPRPGGGLTWAKGSFETLRGTISVSWRVAGRGLEVDVEVPEGVEAVISLSEGEERIVGPGKHKHVILDNTTQSVLTYTQM